MAKVLIIPETGKNHNFESLTNFLNIEKKHICGYKRFNEYVQFDVCCSKIRRFFCNADRFTTKEKEHGEA